jgi:hypothetical protein
MLLAAFLTITAQWRQAFVQRRLLLRAQRQALGALLVLGRASLSRILWTNGREQHSWSAEYFLHSRANWDPQALFAPLLKEGLSWCPGRLVAVAVDDTRVRKTGRGIKQASYYRDPFSPPFHVNLMLGLRFLQASLLLPLHRSGQVSARAIPIRFEAVATVKKPGKRADAQAWEQYRADRKRFNLSQRFVASAAQIRTALDQAGGASKILVIAGDGSFCNRIVLGTLPARSELIGRARKDAKLCLAAAPGTRRIYDADKFRPSKCAMTRTSPGNRLRSSTAARAAKFAINQLPTYSGNAARAAGRGGCSSSHRPPIANAGRAAGTIARPPICSAPTAKTHRINCSRSTSTAGRSK